MVRLQTTIAASCLRCTPNCGLGGGVVSHSIQLVTARLCRGFNLDIVRRCHTRWLLSLMRQTKRKGVALERTRRHRLLDLRQRARPVAICSFPVIQRRNRASRLTQYDDGIPLGPTAIPRAIMLWPPGQTPNPSGSISTSTTAVACLANAFTLICCSAATLASSGVGPQP
jgi:hypothetical protein